MQSAVTSISNIWQRLAGLFWVTLQSWASQSASSWSMGGCHQVCTPPCAAPPCAPRPAPPNLTAPHPTPLQPNPLRFFFAAMQTYHASARVTSMYNAIAYKAQRPTSSLHSCHDITQANTCCSQLLGNLQLLSQSWHVMGIHGIFAWYEPLQ